MSNDGRHLITALRRSHDHLSTLVSPLDEAAVQRPSYADEWSIAQVCSHLGSGAEINLQWLQAAVAHREAPSRDEMPAIWDRWNARAPMEQVSEGVRADEAHVSAL